MIYLLAFAAVFAVLGFLPSGNAGGSALADFVATITGRGARVGPRTSLDEGGIVPDDPQALADAAALPLDTYALARMVASEEGTSPVPYKIAVAWAARNASAGSPAHLLLAGKGEGEGHFKRQGYRTSDGTKHVGYAATFADPYRDDVDVATAVLGGTLADITGGASHFFRPQLQDKLFAEGKVSADGDATIAKWTAGGLAAVDVDGVNGDELAFFKEAVASG